MTRWFRTVTKCGQDTKNKEERHIKTPNRHSPCGNTLLDGKTRSPRQIGRLKSMEYRNSRFIAMKSLEIKLYTSTQNTIKTEVNEGDIKYVHNGTHRIMHK